MKNKNISYLYKIPTKSGIHHYTVNASPLANQPLAKIPTSKIRPDGWIRDVLRLMADGLAGHLCETSDFMTPTNGWLQPERMETDIRRLNDTYAPGETIIRRSETPTYNEIAWEEQAYWLRGAWELAVLLKDERLLNLTGEYIEAILGSAEDDGWFGPQCLKYPLGRDSKEKIVDVWPHMIVIDMLKSYYDDFGDERVLKVLDGFFRFIADPSNNCLMSRNLPELGDVWQPAIQNTRACDILPHLSWMYAHTGEKYLIDLAERIYKTYGNIVDEKKYCSYHGVDFAQSFGYPALHYKFSADTADLKKSEKLYNDFIKDFGRLPGGAIAADELAREGKTDPRQGFESCAMIELNRTYSLLGELTGDPVYSDRSEEVMLNSYPAALTPDMKAIHYLTPVNIPEIDERPRDYTNRGCQLGYAERGTYRCCVHNHSMGWPLYAERAIMAADGDGAAVWLYEQCEANVKVAGGIEAKIKIETDYPFNGNVKISVSCCTPTKFPLYLRIPGWCETTKLTVDGNTTLYTGEKKIIMIDGQWDNHIIELSFEQKVKITRFDSIGDCASVSRGPLFYSLYIKEDWYTKQLEKYSIRCVKPGTPWNYALKLDSVRDVREGESVKITGQPWDSISAPICLYVKGKRLDSWKVSVEDNTIEPLPQSPVESSEDEEELKLIPMGCARLRICCFPVLVSSEK